MRKFFFGLIFAALVLLTGCQTPWVAGDVVECLPQHTEKCHADLAFFVEKTEKRVQKTLEDALRARGFTVVEHAVESDVRVVTTITSHEYNDKGFWGPGARDDMSLTITLVDRRKRTVLGRWRVTLKSDFRILERCVDKM